MFGGVAMIALAAGPEVAAAAFWSLVVWFVLGGLVVNAACVANTRWLKRAEVALSGDGQPDVPSAFLFVVPTTGEPLLERSLEALQAVDVPAGVRIETIVVGAGGLGQGVAERRVDAYRRGRPLRHPLRGVSTGRPEGDKSDNLNYVVDVLSDSLSEFDYFVIVDSDTRVPPNLVERMRAAVAEAAGAGAADRWPVLLQPVVAAIPADPGSATNRAEAVMQTRWRLGYEHALLRVARSGAAARRRSWMPLSYAVGACLGVRTERAGKRFTAPAEDLQLGYELSSEVQAIAPVRAVAVTTTKATLGEIARRHAAWYAGSHIALGRKALPRRWRDVRLVSLVAIERLRLLAWVPGPLLVVLSAALQVATNPAGAAAANVGIIAGLAVVTYSTAVPIVQSCTGSAAPRTRRLSTCAACLVRWAWSSSLPALFLAAEALERLALPRRIAVAASNLSQLPIWPSLVYLPQRAADLTEIPSAEMGDPAPAPSPPA